MNTDYIINLTLSVCRLSENWEDSNFLKFKLKNSAYEVLCVFVKQAEKNPVSGTDYQVSEKIEAFQQTLKQIRAQKLISRNDFLFLQKEYNVLRKRIEKGPVSLKREKPAPIIGSELKKAQEQVKEKQKSAPSQDLKQDLNQRQNKILEMLREKQKAQVWELKPFFPDVSKRTLRRDLDDLLKKGLVQRKGEWNKIFYHLA